MQIANNITLERLKNGHLALGLIIKLHAGVEMAKIAKACDHDFLFIDMQHAGISIETTTALCIAALDTGVTPLVRVLRSDASLATRLLDNGAMGIIVPDVQTAEHAREIVSNCRFPPLGRRSVGVGYPQLGYGTFSTAEAVSILNQQTLLVAMIESSRGVENAMEIAAVPGIDVVHIGSNDLMTNMGLADEVGKPSHFSLAERVLKACEANCKIFGMGGVRDPELQARFVALGARMLTTNSDTAFLMAAMKDRARLLRAEEKAIMGNRGESAA